MSLDDKIALTGRLLKAGGALVSLAAPTAGLVNIHNLPSPLPATAYIILPTISLALIVAILIRGPAIARLTSNRAASLTLAFALAGGLFTAGYALAADKLVIERREGAQSTDSQISIRPIFPSSYIQNTVSEYDNDYHDAAEDDETFRTALQSEQLHSIIALLIIMTFAQLCFVAALVGGTWWLAERYAKRPPTRRGG